jgi:hypothetical protein
MVQSLFLPLRMSILNTPMTKVYRKRHSLLLLETSENPARRACLPFQTRSFSTGHSWLPDKKTTTIRIRLENNPPRECISPRNCIPRYALTLPAVQNELFSLIRSRAKKIPLALIAFLLLIFLSNHMSLSSKVAFDCISLPSFSSLVLD